jgi:hypothetical protein
MDWERAMPVGDGYAVVSDGSNTDDKWFLTNGMGDRAKRERFFFDATAFPPGDRRVAAVAAAEEHLRLCDPADHQACNAREDYHRQRIEAAQNSLAAGKDLGDVERQVNAMKVIEASRARLAELGELVWQPGT